MVVGVVVGGMVVVVIPANQIIFCTAVHCRMGQNEMILIVGNVGGKSVEGTNAICILLSTAPTNIH